MKRRIKISYFIGSLRLGGAEKQVVELALGLDPSRFEVEICCINQGGPMVESVREAGIPVHIHKVYLPYGKYSPASYLHLYREIRKITRHIREWKPDIIHGYLFAAYVVGILCGKKAGVPILISSRRSLGFFKDAKAWQQKLENYVNRRTLLILANSKAVCDDVISREKHCRGKLRLIYNGVDLEKYRPEESDPEVRREWNIGKDDIVVGCVANLIHYKGHLEILEAAVPLVAEFPDLKFVFVGRDGGMKRKIVEKRSALGLEKNVILAGTRQDVERIIPAFDILLLASHEEGFSNVLLEGMACGIPIVATNVGGNPESVLDGETGFIVPPKNPGEMTRALGKLMKDPALRGRFGTAGRRRVEKEFSKEKLIQTMDEFYTDLAREKLHIDISD